jgi:HlyD family secretion protein
MKLSLSSPILGKLSLPLLGAFGLTLGAGVLISYQLLRYQDWGRSQTPPVATNPVNPAAGVAVAALGTIEPQGEVVTISAPTFAEGSPRLQNLLVKQGDRVETGKIIAILDNQPRLQKALEQSQAQAKVAFARLQQVQAGAKQGTIQAQEARSHRTTTELEGQIAARKFFISSLITQKQGEMIGQQATIERIQAQLINAQAECQRYQSLHQDGAIALQEKERICLQQKTLEKSFQEAKSLLKMRQGVLQSQIQEANAELSKAVGTLERQLQEERATLAAIAEVRPVDVEVALAEWQAAMSAVKKARADLDLAYIRAPQAGQILEVHTKAGERVKSEGIVDIGQTEQMFVTAEVYETDVERVQVGQKAIAKAAHLSTNLEGTVTEIGLQIGRKNALGTDPVADADARVVEVKIRLNPQSSRLVKGLTNLQVDVIIDASVNANDSKKP